jgi:hypothetical protein
VALSQRHRAGVRPTYQNWAWEQGLGIAALHKAAVFPAHDRAPGLSSGGVECTGAVFTPCTDALTDMVYCVLMCTRSCTRPRCLALGRTLCSWYVGHVHGVMMMMVTWLWLWW